MSSFLDILNLSGKDTRWLELEICREFQRNKCLRPETECKFGHATADLVIQNGRVIACYDSIRGRCNRIKPKCKYFHPPEHLKHQLLVNGRRYLELKNAIKQQVSVPAPAVQHQIYNQQFLPQQNPQYHQQQLLLPGQVPVVTVNPYIMGLPHLTSSYLSPNAVNLGSCSPYGILSPTIVTQSKTPEFQSVGVDIKPLNTIQCENITFPGMVLCKAPPVYKSNTFQAYHPNMVTYFASRVDDGLILNQAKVAKLKIGQKLKRV